MELAERKPDRVEVKETPLWRLENHPDKQKVFEVNRYYDVQDEEWWDYIYQRNQEAWGDMGIEVEQENMYFSGFYSQGDGACFTKCGINWGLLWPHLTGNYPFLARFKEHLPQPELHHSGRYYHEHSVSIDLNDGYSYSETAMCDAAILERYPKMTPYCQGGYTGNFEMWNDLALRFQDRFQFELNALEQEIIDLLRGLMAALYKDLEEEYDELTSDEYLTERFNDDPEIMFDRQGKAYHF